jgi:hypothetical protein
MGRPGRPFGLAKQFNIWYKELRGKGTTNAISRLGATRGVLMTRTTRATMVVTLVGIAMAAFVAEATCPTCTQGSDCTAYQVVCPNPGADCSCQPVCGTPPSCGNPVPCFTNTCAGLVGDCDLTTSTCQLLQNCVDAGGCQMISRQCDDQCLCLALPITASPPSCTTYNVCTVDPCEGYSYATCDANIGRCVLHQ